MFLIIFFLIKSDCILKLYAFDCIYTGRGFNGNYTELRSNPAEQMKDILVHKNCFDKFYMYLRMIGGNKYVSFFLFVFSFFFPSKR